MGPEADGRLAVDLVLFVSRKIEPAVTSELDEKRVELPLQMKSILRDKSTEHTSKRLFSSSIVRSAVLL